MNVTVFPGGCGEAVEPDWAAIFTDELLRARASDVWRVTAQEMRDAGTFAPVNCSQLRRYVMSQVIYEDAAAKVAEQGALRVGKAGKATYNLWFAVLKDTDALASNHEEKLGLNPRRRAQVAPAKKARKTTTAADNYLGRSGTRG